MATYQKTFDLGWGFTLTQLYSDQGIANPTPDQLEAIRVSQCGAVSFYQDLLRQLHANALERFDNPDGTNRFLKRSQLRVYGDVYRPGSNAYDNPMPLTYPDGRVWTYTYTAQYADGGSVIDMRFIEYRPDRTSTPNEAASAISHELGHAFHAFARSFYDTPAGRVVRKWFSSKLASNGVAYSDASPQYPWLRPDGSVEKPEEGFANAYRYFKGADCTRFSSGTMNGGVDAVAAGFEDPANHPEWLGVINNLPDLMAYCDAYGILDGSLQWLGSATGGGYQFQNGSGTWIYYSATGSWMRWNGASWQTFDPGTKRL